MTHLRLIRGGSRPNLAELEPGLRDRILALDEPAGREDWADVLGRSRSLRPWASPLRLFALLAAAAAIVVGAGVSSGLRSGDGSSVLAVSRVAPEFDLGSEAAVGGIASSTPVTLSMQLTAGSHALYVSKKKGGGFCYEWADEAHGCLLRAAPLGVAWSNDRVVGTVSARQVSSVEVRFTDGTMVEPSISWVARPISTGFFSYAIPPGKTVAFVIATDHGLSRGRVPWYSV